jgi:hypothetical protein
MRPTHFCLLFSSSLLLTACGGMVRFGDGEDDGEGGNGGAGGTTTVATTNSTTNSSTSSTMTTNAQSVSVSTTSVGGAPPLDCKGACDALYFCGLQNGLCPGFDGSPQQQAGFVEGCTETCIQQPALINLVDPSNCDQTITTLKGVSPDFQVFCDGPPPPPPG